MTTSVVSATADALRRQARSDSRVHRRSIVAGRERAVKVPRQERGVRLKALLHEIRTRKVPGFRRGHAGSLSAAAADVYEYLQNLAAAYEGKVCPSYIQIAKAVGWTVKTCVAAVRQLVAFGWLDYDRRVREGDEPGGPRYVQTSNWYRCLVPERARELIAKWRGKGKERTQRDDSEAERQAKKRAWLEAAEAAERAQKREALEARHPVIARAGARATPSPEARNQAPPDLDRA